MLIVLSSFIYIIVFIVSLQNIPITAKCVTGDINNLDNPEVFNQYLHDAQECSKIIAAGVCNSNTNKNCQWEANDNYFDYQHILLMITSVAINTIPAKQLCDNKMLDPNAQSSFIQIFKENCASKLTENDYRNIYDTYSVDLPTHDQSAWVSAKRKCQDELFIQITQNGCPHYVSRKLTAMICSRLFIINSDTATNADVPNMFFFLCSVWYCLFSYVLFFSFLCFLLCDLRPTNIHSNDLLCFLCY